MLVVEEKDRIGWEELTLLMEKQVDIDKKEEDWERGIYNNSI